MIGSDEEAFGEFLRKARGFLTIGNTSQIGRIFSTGWNTMKQIAKSGGAREKI